MTSLLGFREVPDVRKCFGVQVRGADDPSPTVQYIAEDVTAADWGPTGINTYHVHTTSGYDA